MTSLTQQDLAVIRDITQDIVYLTIGSKKHIEINSLVINYSWNDVYLEFNFRQLETYKEFMRAVSSQKIVNIAIRGSKSLGTIYVKIYNNPNCVIPILRYRQIITRAADMKISR